MQINQESFIQVVGYQLFDLRDWKEEIGVCCKKAAFIIHGELPRNLKNTKNLHDLFTGLKGVCRFVRIDVQPLNKIARMVKAFSVWYNG